MDFEIREQLLKTQTITELKNLARELGVDEFDVVDRALLYHIGTLQGKQLMEYYPDEEIEIGYGEELVPWKPGMMKSILKTYDISEEENRRSLLKAEMASEPDMEFSTSGEFDIAEEGKRKNLSQSKTLKEMIYDCDKKAEVIDFETREQLLKAQTLPELKSLARELGIDAFDAEDFELVDHIEELQYQQLQKYCQLKGHIWNSPRCQTRRPGMVFSILDVFDFLEDD